MVEEGDQEINTIMKKMVDVEDKQYLSRGKWVSDVPGEKTRANGKGPVSKVELKIKNELYRKNILIVKGKL